MSWSDRIAELETQSQKIALGGGQKSIDRQHSKGRLTARERIDALLDDSDGFLEIGRWAAFGMYEEWGGSVSASVVCGIGKIEGRLSLIHI